MSAAEPVLGERFHQWVAERFPGIADDTLIHYQWVASKYQDNLCQQRSLSFTHHALVANVEPISERTKLLKRAEKGEKRPAFENKCNQLQSE